MKLKKVLIWISLISGLGCQKVDNKNIQSDNLNKPEVTDSFRTFLTDSHNYLVNQQAICEEEYSLGQFERWHYDQVTGLLTFYNGDTLKLKIKYQEVGSISKVSGTWLWGWANPNLEEKVVAEMDKVRLFGKENQFDQLTKRKWEADEIDGWEMTSISANILKAKGAYRVPTETVFAYFIFLSIEKVDIIKKNQ